jgi:mannose-6-phosphate isomerase-like protein (cupin superfamily)
MNRKHFLQATGILTAGMMLHSYPTQASEVRPANEKDLEAVLLTPLPPLDHNGSLNIRTRIKSEMTNGLYSSVECVVAPKTMGPPPHLHKSLDELMYVTEGSAHILIGDEIIEVQAGGWHLRPRNIKHTFWNASTQPLRFIDMYFNQPFEEYLEKIFFELTDANGYPEGSVAKIDAIQKLNQEFEVYFAADSWDERQNIINQFQLQ